MKSKKTWEEVDWQSCSAMRWVCGEEVNAFLDWDERRYYLWFEPTYGFEMWCAEVCEKEHNNNLMELLSELKEQLNDIGIQEFCDLEAVNEFCKQFCGSDDPYDCAEFYEDEWGNIRGA